MCSTAKGQWPTSAAWPATNHFWNVSDIQASNVNQAILERLVWIGTNWVSPPAFTNDAYWRDVDYIELFKPTITAIFEAVYWADRSNAVAGDYTTWLEDKGPTDDADIPRITYTNFLTKYGLRTNFWATGTITNYWSLQPEWDALRRALNEMVWVVNDTTWENEYTGSNHVYEGRTVNALDETCEGALAAVELWKTDDPQTPTWWLYAYAATITYDIGSTNLYQAYSVREVGRYYVPMATNLSRAVDFYGCPVNMDLDTNIPYSTQGMGDWPTNVWSRWCTTATSSTSVVYSIVFDQGTNSLFPTEFPEDCPSSGQVYYVGFDTMGADAVIKFDVTGGFKYTNNMQE